MDGEIQARAQKAAGSWRPPGWVASQEETARALLRAESARDKARVAVAPHEEGKVSLPASVRNARCADLIGGARAGELLERFIERHRRSANGVIR